MKCYLRTLLDVSALITFVGFICFYKLGSFSLGSRDESLYALATQGILMNGQWWRPTLNGRFFAMKPPLKLWLNAIVIHFLGQSNFSFRVVDATCGVLLALLLFFSAKRWTQSRLVAFISVFSLFGCSQFISLHGPRQGVLDALLLLLNTATLYLGWEFLSESERLKSEPDQNKILASKKRLWRLCFIGGIVLGLSILTKSAGGLVPLFILGVYALISRSLFRFTKDNWIHLFLLVVIALLISAPYFVGHCLFTNKACKTLIFQDILNRASKGYANTDNPWMYVEQLLEPQSFFPPLLLICALLLAGFRLWKNRSALDGFLLLWALLPILIFSLAASRLTWYIYVSLPAFAILIGLACRDVLLESHEQFRKWWSSEGISPLGLTFSFLICVGFAHLLIANMWNVLTGVTLVRERIPADRVFSEVQDFLAEVPNESPVVFYGEDSFAFRETAYRNFVIPKSKRISDLSALSELIKKSEALFVITRVEHLSDVLPLRAVSSFKILPARYGRSKPIAFLCYAASDKLPSFANTTQSFEFTKASDHYLYGWGDDGAQPGRTYVTALGPGTAFLIESNPLLALQGGTLKIILAAKETSNLDIYLSETFLGNVEAPRDHFGTVELTIPPGAFSQDRDVLRLIPKPRPGLELKPDTETVLLHLLSIDLR